MAKLKKCKACGHEISAGAKICQNCGHPQKKSSVKIILIVLGVLILIGIIVGVLSPQTPSTNNSTAASSTPDDTQLMIEACDYAQDAVKERLKAPSTAKFPSCGFDMDKYTIKTNKNRTEFFVTGYVDAQNSFGAMLRENFGVILKRDGEHWTVVKAAISN